MTRTLSGLRVGLLFTLLIGVIPNAAVAAPKTDVIELVNGDRITCEIQKLDRGKLTVKTDGIGTISIEWDDVDRVTSRASYDVELASGQRVFGSLVRGDARTIDVETSLGQQRIPIQTIVRVSPLGRTFWRRLDGGIDAGFNFTEANVQTQWTFHSTVSYRSRYWFSEISGDSLLTTREDADRQTRNTMSIQSQRSMGLRWSASGFAQLQQNEELSLDLRTVVGAGVGRILTQSNRTAFVMLGALAFTHEQYQDLEPDDVTEAVGGVNWEWFTFDGRSTNLDIGALSFYALNHDSRIRLELNSSFKSDIVGDLYWSVNLFESYNSAPPTGQKKNDSGVSAAIGWTF